MPCQEFNARIRYVLEFISHDIGNASQFRELLRIMQPDGHGGESAGLLKNSLGGREGQKEEAVVAGAAAPPSTRTAAVARQGTGSMAGIPGAMSR